jgi:hypothetical protein
MTWLYIFLSSRFVHLAISMTLCWLACYNLKALKKVVLQVEHYYHAKVFNLQISKKVFVQDKPRFSQLFVASRLNKWLRIVLLVHCGLAAALWIEEAFWICQALVTTKDLLSRVCVDHFGSVVYHWLVWWQLYMWCNLRLFLSVVVKIIITRKMISSGGASLRSWHQLYSRVFVRILIFESLSLLPQYATGRYV